MRLIIRASAPSRIDEPVADLVHRESGSRRKVLLFRFFWVRIIDILVVPNSMSVCIS